MKNGPSHGGRATDDVAIVSMPAHPDTVTATRHVDLVLSTAVTRSRRMHWRITAQRRHSKALDHHLNPADPWDWAEPVGDHWRTSAMSWEQRTAAGQRLAERRWAP